MRDLSPPQKVIAMLLTPPAPSVSVKSIGRVSLHQQWQSPAVREAGDKRDAEIRITRHFVVLGLLETIFSRTTGRLLYDRSGKEARAFPAAGSDLIGCGEDDVAVVKSGDGLEGRDLATGRVRWTHDGSTTGAGHGLGVFGCVFAERSPQSKAAHLCRTCDGRMLDPRNAGDWETLRSVVKEYGARIVPVQDGRSLYTLDLLSGALTPTHRRGTDFERYGAELETDAVATEGQNLIEYVDLDNGGVGHSVWPKFITAFNPSGKQVWQFPKRILWDRWGQAGVGSSIQLPPVWLRSAHSLLVPSDDGLYCVSTANGRARWRIGNHKDRTGAYQWFPPSLRLRPCGHNVLVSLPSGTGSRAYPPYNLYLMNLRNGHLRCIVTHLPGGWFAVHGNDLYILSETAISTGVHFLTIHCYKLGSVH